MGSWLALTALVLCGCGGGGMAYSSSTPPKIFCTGVAPQSDPMTSPAAGATGVPTTIGAIIVPVLPFVQGSSLTLETQAGQAITAGTFAPSGISSQRATVPTLSPNTTYHAVVLNTTCGGFLFDFGSFTTGSS